MVSLDLKKLVVSDFNSKRFTVAQIASRHGVSTAAVYKWVREEAEGRLGESMTGKVPRTGKITDDISRNIISMYESGNGITLIGKTIGLSPMSVKKHLEKLGVYKGTDGAKDRMSKLSDKDVDDIIDDYCNTDMAVYDISSKYGITESYVRQILWKNNIEVQHKARKGVLTAPKHKIKDEVIKSYKSGALSHSDLATKYGVSTRTISRILKEAGIEAIGIKPYVPVTKVLEIKEGVIQDIANGLDVYALAEKYGVKIGVIESIASDAVASESTGDSKAERIMTEYNNGSSIKDIVQQCGVALSTVYRVLKQNGVDVKEKREDTVKVVEVNENVARVAELHSQGLMLKDIADKADMPIHKVRKILEELGLELNSPAEKHKELVFSLARAGKSAKDIALEVGISVPTVRKLLDESGISLKDIARERKEETPVEDKKGQRNDLVMKCVAEGLTVNEIAEKVGISIPTVRKVLADNGVELNRGKPIRINGT